MVPRVFKHRPGLWLLLLALLAIAAGALWWRMAHWRPDPAAWPVQGVWLTGQEDARTIAALPASGARFAYVTASDGARIGNAQFSAMVEAARGAGLQAGAVHRYDPCIGADRQSAMFVTLVPRDADLLPPAIELDRSGEACRPRVRPAEVESELVVFLNQIEMHAGKRALLAPSAGFEAQYGFGAKSARELWLARDWREPGYAGRPWELWTANARYRGGAAGDRLGGIWSEPLRWVVARP